MKKIFILMGVVISLGFAQAASVDWKITGSSSDVGQSIYLLTSLASSYESAEQLTSSALGMGSIAKNGRSYYFSGTLAGDSFDSTSLKDAYLVIIQDNKYTYLQVDMSNYVYDPNNQESSKGFFTKAYSDIAAGTSYQFVPEPTSGLLMLLGAAGLALRRKRS